jgi:hypothetical protein
MYLVGPVLLGDFPGEFKHLRCVGEARLLSQAVADLQHDFPAWRDIPHMATHNNTTTQQ